MQSALVQLAPSSKVGRPLIKEENLDMQIPMELKPAVIGAVVGAGALAIAGFSWGGWQSAATAEAGAKQQVSQALVKVLAPICVANYRLSQDATVKLAELKKANAWERGSFVEKAGWAKMPGSTVVDSATARACGDMIAEGKL